MPHRGGSGDYAEWKDMDHADGVENSIVTNCVCPSEMWELKVGNIVSGYGPGSEKTEDEREEFWKALSEFVNRF
jgi:hypothetical protein